jgi:hypothetical protein
MWLVSTTQDFGQDSQPSEETQQYLTIHSDSAIDERRTGCKYETASRVRLWASSDRIWAASDTRCHMHAGKRLCGPLRCDDATEMQVEGLDAHENAAGPDCPPAGTADA